MQGLRQWLVDTYNGIYLIVMKPHMPRRASVGWALAGVLIGLLFAYMLSPVQYYDGAPNQMSQNARDEWVKLVAAAKAANIYNDEDIIRYLQLVEDPAGSVERLIGETSQSVRAALESLRPLVYDSQGNGIAGRPAPRPGSFFGDIIGIVIWLIITMVLVVISVLLWNLLIRPSVVNPIREAIRPKTDEDRLRKEGMEQLKALRQQEEELRRVSAATPQTNPYGAPMLQRLAVYVKGRGFDESFGIEDAASERKTYFGECGATVASSVGDSAAAFELFVFDQQEMARMYTRVIASERAFSAPELRSDLEDLVDNPATDIIIAKPGAVITIELARLLVQYKIVDIKPTPTAPNSTFDSVTFQIEAWFKGDPNAAAPAPVLPQATQPSPVTYAPAPAPVTYAPAPVAAPPPQQVISPYAPAPVNPPMPQPYAPVPQPPETFTPSVPPIEDDPFGGTADFEPYHPI
jgi:hypothetical protein